ncbi:hypothetical protein LP420_19920 [Massilia sp. B-10]|nr:hypothetical protein LP420_19920 [Massilia sp. B-10]
MRSRSTGGHFVAARAIGIQAVFAARRFDRARVGVRVDFQRQLRGAIHGRHDARFERVKFGLPDVDGAKQIHRVAVARHLEQGAAVGPQADGKARQNKLRNTTII